MKQTVKLVSAEGYEFIVDYKAACVSNTIRNMLSSQGAPVGRANPYRMLARQWPLGAKLSYVAASRYYSPPNTRALPTRVRGARLPASDWSRRAPVVRFAAEPMHA